MRKERVPYMYNVNKQFFDQWSEPMAYVLGYFCADGCLYRSSSGYYTIILSSSNSQILYDIRSAMESEHPLHANETQLRIGNAALTQSLIRHLDITNQKNRNLVYPTIPREYFPHFLRGYFDGNGSFIVEQGRRVISSITCPSEQFLEGLRDELVLYGLTRANINSREGLGTTYEIRYYVNDTRKLYDLMYGGATIYCRAKRQHYDAGQRS